MKAQKSIPVRVPGTTPAPLGGEGTAAIQQITRAAHSQERAQDYVETIADLILEHGEARAIDLAKAFGVTHVTVIRTVQRLQRDGLVKTRPYRSIFLTEAGSRLAVQAKARHRVVLEFLMALGVPEEVAKVDAEGIEHHVSPETLEAFHRFLSAAPPRSPARSLPS